MFKVGDVVLYGAQGICKIDSTEQKKIGKTVAEYYVLKPIYNENTSVFVPMNNQQLLSRMSSILTKKQANDFIANSHTVAPAAILDESVKNKEYKAILASSNRVGTLSVLKSICIEKEQRRKNGKKLNLNDEQLLRQAQNLIYGELAYVLEITVEEVEERIKL